MNGASASLSLTGVTVGNLIIAQVIEDGYDGGGTDFGWGTLTGGESLNGTSGAYNQFTGDVYTNGWIVGPSATPTAVQWIALFRATATSVTFGMTSAGNDCYARMYEFSGANTGTTLADVVENGSAGVAANGSATSATVADTAVTTLGPNRLALNFIAVNDDNQADLTAMTGETGGDWTYPVAAYGNSLGTDGAVALVTATIASTGTINGGSDAMAVSDSWGVVGFALTEAVVIYTDSATVYNDLTPTGSDIAERVDSATIPLDIVSSGTDIREIPDAATVYADLTTSGTELLSHEYTDSATILLDLNTSASDASQFADAATNYFDLSASGTDVTDSTDNAIIPADLQPSGTELAEYIDSATIYFDLQSQSAELADFVESQTVYLDLQSSGSDTHESGGPKQTTVGRVTFSDVNEPSYRTDHRLHVWASLANGAHTGYLGFQLYEGASAIGSELYTASLTGSEVEYVLSIADIDAQSIVDYTDLELAFVGYADTGDSAQFRIHDVQLEVPAAVPVERTDSATVYFDLRTTSTEVAEFADTGSIYFDLQSSGTDVAVFADTATAYFDLQASGTETLISATQDADTAYFDLQASGTDTPVRTDAEQIYFDLNTFTIDIAEFVDGTTVKLLVLPATTEERISYDSALVYFDLQAGSILLQVDFLLDIIECTARWVIEKPIKTRWQLLDLIARVVTETAIARWTIMETRRFKWKS